MDTATIQDRLGRTVSSERVANAQTLAPAVNPTGIPTMWHVGPYRVIVDSGRAVCDCAARIELCKHVLAVWVRQYSDGQPVRIASVDGAPLTVVDDTDDPFVGLS